jgi:hypothetical protein
MVSRVSLGLRRTKDGLVCERGELLYERSRTQVRYMD